MFRIFLCSCPLASFAQGPVYISKKPGCLQTRVARRQVLSIGKNVNCSFPESFFIDPVTTGNGGTLQSRIQEKPNWREGTKLTDR